MAHREASWEIRKSAANGHYNLTTCRSPVTCVFSINTLRAVSAANKKISKTRKKGKEKNVVAEIDSGFLLLTVFFTLKQSSFLPSSSLIFFSVSSPALLKHKNIVFFSFRFDCFSGEYSGEMI